MELIGRYRVGYVYAMKRHIIVEDVYPLGADPIADTDIEFGQDEESGEIVVRFVMIITGEGIDTSRFPEDVNIGLVDGGVVVWREIDRIGENFLEESRDSITEEQAERYKKEALAFFRRFVIGKEDSFLM